MLEIICMNVEDAKTVQECGADRIELVSALTEGGLTPSYAMIENVVKAVDIPVNVMIRPHANSFVYSKEDLDVMVKDIEIAKELGVNGVVLCVLDNENNINEEHLNLLLEKCDGLDVTFHKAIEETNLIKSMNILNKYKKITTVLTAGGKDKIENNIDKINDMKLYSGNIDILLGGGLNFDNIREIQKLTNNTSYHFGTAVRVENSPFKKIDKDKLKELVEIIK